MRVRAKMPPSGRETFGSGYYGHRLFRGGEEFELSDPSHFSSKWMEKIEGPSVVSGEIDLKRKQK